MSLECLKNMNENYLKFAVLSAVSQELQNANHFVTKQTIHLRVLKQVADILNLPWNYTTNLKSIYLHPENLKIIIDLWKNITTPLSHEELSSFEKMKSADFIKIPDMIKFITILLRKYTVERGKENILNSKDMSKLLGVDGFLGYFPQDLKNYIDNLKHFNSGDNHLNTVKDMYNLDLLEKLTGTDSTCIIFIALLIVYKKIISDDQAQLIIEKIITNTINYLERNVEFNENIKIALANINDITQYYESKMIQSEIERIGTVKVAEIINKSKKKNHSSPEKRGRKRILIADVDDQDITMKRKRKVKPFSDIKV